MDLNRFPFSQVATWLTEGSVIPFLGAGASRIGVTESSPLPDGRALALELIKKMGGAFPGAEPDPDTCREELAKVAQFYEAVFDRDALHDFIVNRFHQENAQLSLVAKLLAAMPTTAPLFLMTTNYDSQIERAMRAAGRPTYVITQNMRDPEHGASRVEVTYPDGTVRHEESSGFQWYDRARPPDGNTVYLFKMHGSASPGQYAPRDDIIITEDDYVDFLVNCGGPVSPYFPPPSLANVYRDGRFLFLGYSLDDWNFRAFLRLLTLRNALSGKSAKKHWAIQLKPSPLDESLWRQRNVDLYKGDLIDFCRNLEANWHQEETA